MILYHCITTYHLLEFIVHSLTNSTNEERILIVPEFLYNRTENITELIQLKVFSDVKVMRYRAIPHNENYLQKTNDYFNLLDIDLSVVNEINVAGAQYYFSAMLIEKEIKFNFWEEASGVLTQHESVENIVNGISEHQHFVAKKNGMYDGDNKFVNRIYCNFNAQNETFIPTDKTIDFNIGRELKKLDSRQIKLVLDFFRVPRNLQVVKESALILTQHFANLGMMSFDNQIELYQTTVDYFLPNKRLIFKVHPDDLIYYSQLFKESIVIHEKFPSELLPFVSNEIPDTVAAVSSTGIRNISNEFSKCLSFNILYEKSFKDNNKYYLCLKIIKSCLNKKIKIYLDGINEIQLRNMSVFGDINIQFEVVDNPDKANFLVLNFLSNDFEFSNFVNLCNKIPIIMISNDNLDIEHYDYLKEAMIVKTIKKSQLADEIYTNLDDEKVYILSNDLNVRRTVMNTKYEKELYYTGIKTTVSETTDDELKIAVLEGILEATEKRLLYYIQREKELLDIINSK